MTREMLNKLSKQDLIELLLMNGNNEIKLENMTGSIWVKAHNNSSLGYKQYGGELYNRCKLTFEIHNGNHFNLIGKYYVPSGYSDGDINNIIVQKVLEEKELIKIKKMGFNNWVEEYFEVKNILDFSDDTPFYKIIN